ncbi:MAG: hypothetical protein IJG25_06090, partial [Thermoguttaceae bacterium]|nr:hypothetical protein [Thermoguttaceae bacterium]
MNFLKNRRFQIENLEERTLLTAAPWSTGDETDYSRLVVTTLEDVVDASDQMTSIREAIAYAETLGGDGEVTFADGLEGTITLARGALTVGADSYVTIDGGGVITIDAGGQSRAFEVGVAGAALNDLGLTGGYHARQGGAVASSGELTMNGVTVSDSYSGKYGSAVYIAPGTSLTVIGSNFTNNISKTHGGGIFVEKGAQADISGSRFEGNSTGSYGAAVYVWNDAAVSVTDTFFVNNIAPNGTIRNYGGELTLTNVVLTGNDQGISSSDGGVNVGINVTMTGNARSAVRGEEGAAFTFYNSVILGGNKTFDLRTGATVGGDVNLSTAEFGSNFVLYDGGDLFAADGYTPVGANQVMNAGSAAYNTTKFDAAGNNRYYGGAIDIGAVEQIVTVTGKPAVFNGLPQAPFEFAGPVDSVLYSLDGETWTEESPIRDAGTYDVWVKTLTAGGDEEIYLVTAEITPLQLTVAGSAVVDKDADGTTDAEIIVGDAAPLYDDVTVTAAGQFASAEPGTWDVAVTYTVVGEKAGNYIAPVPETLRGTIVWVEPQSLVVTTLEDVVDRYDGVTSIREAIAYAETFDVPVAVTFADDLEGVIELADGALSLGADNSITVDGGGAITIDAGGRSRALEVGAAGAVLSDLTVTGGYDGKQGGAVAAFGDLFLSNVTVTGSFSGKFGGAVYVAPEASLTVVNSAFTGNTANSHGGAIFVDQGASADVFGSYFSGNTTGAYGGAFYVWTGATAQIANSFFVNNSAPNGTIRNYGGSLDLINVVVSGNEQGISGSDGGVTTATNVTISRNTRSAVRGDLGAEFIFYNSILTDGYSLFKLSGGASVGGDNNLSTVSFGTNFIKYNGGDLFGADGYSLWGENQAEGAGDPGYNDTALDAAGKNRYYGGTLDLGALEQIITVTGGSMVFNGEYQAPIELDGPADWILYSEDGENWTETPPARNAGTYTFWVKAGTDDGDEEIYEVTGTITPVQLEVTGSTVVPREYDGTTDAEIAVGDVSPLYDDVTITAAGVYDSPEVGEHDVEVTYTVSGENAGNYIAPAPETLRGEITRPPYYSLVVTTLDDVSDPYDDVNSLREAVAYAETFDVPVTVTFADGLSGTILLADGAITVSAAGAIAIDGNGRITVDGGGASRVFNIRAGEVLLANISITGGYDARYGGAVYNAGDLTLENVEITDSRAGKFGGAVYTAAGSNLTVFDSAFDGNTADSHGGAVFVEKEASAEIGRSLFTGNSTAAYGAALYQWSGSAVEVTDTLFLNNNAPNGTIRNHGGSLVMTNVVVSGNDQGLAASGSAKVLGINLTVSNNRRSAVRGDSNAEFTFLNSIVIGGKTLFNLSRGATVGGDLNLSTKEFGTNFVKYNGGDLFGADGWTLAGHNQAMNAGNPAYNDTLTDAVGNNRYYGGGLDLGAVEQIAKAIGTSVVYNGEYQAPIDVEGPVTWIKYSEDGETWSDTPTTRDAGTYTIYVMVGTDTPGEERVYEITGTITPKAAVLRFNVDDRPYDGTADAAVSGWTLTGLAAGDDVTVTVNSASFADQNAGENKPVTIDYTLGGADLGNYTVSVEDAYGTITRRTLTVDDVTVGEKTYDGTTDLDITIGGIEGVVPGEDVTVTPKGELPSAEPGTYEVTVTFDLEGDDADNYDAPEPITVRVTVEPAVIADVTFDGAEYVYNGQARSIAVSGALATDTVLYSTDGVTYTAALPEFTNAGGYTIYAKVSRANYEDWTGSAELTITPAALTVSFTVADKVYDGTTDATVSGYTLTGLVAGDDVTVTVNSANFADKNAGTDKEVTILYTLGGADLGNYAVTVADADGVITRRTLTLEDVTVGEKIYDGTTDLDITIGAVEGIVPGEDVTVTAVGELPSAEPGTYEVTVTFGLEGDDAGNYDVPEPITVTVTVEPAVIADVTFDDASFVYNGQARSIAVSGALATDTVLYSTDGVTYTAALPEFTNAGDYTIYAKVSRANYEDWTGSATLTITPAALTVSFTVADREYDGTADAAVSGYTLTGLVAGDDVTVTVNSASFADKSAGAGKAVTVDYTLGGADLGNYAVTAAQTAATITPKHLYAIFRAADKVYDGTADAKAGLVECIGLVDGDDVTVDAVGAKFNDKNAGVKTASVSAYAESGADAANYYIFGSIEGAVISAKQLTISGTTVADKWYDGTTDAEITAGTLSGVIDGETVTVTASGAFPSADAGEYDVPVSYTLGGADAANYAAPADETIAAKINHLPTIDVTFDDASFVYNGEARSITVSGTEPGDTVLYSTDGVTYSAALPEYTNAGDYTIYAKVSRANYEDWTGSATLTITPAALTAAFTAEDKVYDGTAAASASFAGFTGLIAGDEVTVTVNSASFADKNAGAGKAVSVDYTVGGAQAGNYTVTAAGVSASISAAALTVNFTAEDKVYDGTAAASAAFAGFTGLIAGDDVTVTVDSASFADANAGENKAVSVTRTVSGADASNYTITDAAVSATIERKQL